MNIPAEGHAGAVAASAAVVGAEVDEAAATGDVSAYRPLGRLGGSLYTHVSDSFRVPVPAGEHLLARSRAPAAD